METLPVLSIAGNDAGALAFPRQADSDEQAVRLWLHGRSVHTRRYYERSVERFRAFVGDRPLALVSVGDLQSFSDALAGEMSTSSRVTLLSAVRSLFTYAHKIGYLPFNVAAAVELPRAKDTLAERILDEADVQRMIAVAEGRTAIMVRLCYGSGVRVSELCGLMWRDVVARDDAGQIAVFGKGSKTRVVLLSRSTWRALMEHRAQMQAQGVAGDDDPVFRSRKRSRSGGYHLDPSQVRRIVYAIAERAGIAVQVSPHWLRHAHASHSLERGAPIHLVQATLGHASVATTGRYLHARPTDSSGRYLPV